VTGWAKYPWWAMRLFGWAFLSVLPVWACLDGAYLAVFTMLLSGLAIEVASEITSDGLGVRNAMRKLGLEVAAPKGWGVSA
jgi:hypothetical protein